MKRRGLSAHLPIVVLTHANSLNGLAWVLSMECSAKLGGKVFADGLGGTLANQGHGWALLEHALKDLSDIFCTDSLDSIHGLFGAENAIGKQHAFARLLNK